MVEAAPIRKCHLNNYYTIKVGREYKPGARKRPLCVPDRAGTNDDGPHNPALTMSIMTLTAQAAVLQCLSLYYLETLAAISLPYIPCHVPMERIQGDELFCLFQHENRRI